MKTPPHSSSSNDEGIRTASLGHTIEAIEREAGKPRVAAFHRGAPSYFLKNTFYSERGLEPIRSGVTVQYFSNLKLRYDRVLDLRRERRRRKLWTFFCY